MPISPVPNHERPALPKLPKGSGPRSLTGAAQQRVALPDGVALPGEVAATRRGSLAHRAFRTRVQDLAGMAASALFVSGQAALGDVSRPGAPLSEQVYCHLSGGRLSVWQVRDGLQVDVDLHGAARLWGVSAPRAQGILRAVAAGLHLACDITQAEAGLHTARDKARQLEQQIERAAAARGLDAGWLADPDRQAVAVMNAEARYTRFHGRMAKLEIGPAEQAAARAQVEALVPAYAATRSEPARWIARRPWRRGPAWLPRQAVHAARLATGRAAWATQRGIGWAVRMRQLDKRVTTAIGQEQALIQLITARNDFAAAKDLAAARRQASRLSLAIHARIADPMTAPGSPAAAGGDAAPLPWDPSPARREPRAHSAALRAPAPAPPPGPARAAGGAGISL